MSGPSFFRTGLPMIGFTVLGSLGLAKFIDGKNEISEMVHGKRTLTTREYDIEEDFKKTLEKLDLENYDNKRIERPSDETSPDDVVEFKTR